MTNIMYTLFIFSILVLTMNGCGGSGNDVQPNRPDKKSSFGINTVNEDTENNSGREDAVASDSLVNKLETISNEDNLDISIEKVEIKDGNISGEVTIVNTSKYVYYSSNQYKIIDTKKMERLLREFIGYDKVKFNLVGHTDSVGSDKYNQILSELRAKEVYKSLVELGFNKENLDYVGYGEEQPISTNDTEEGRSSNRRVEIIISATNELFIKFMATREIESMYLNNHSEIGKGIVEISQKGITKDKNEAELNHIMTNIMKPKRDGLELNISKRTRFIKH